MELKSLPKDERFTPLKYVKSVRKVLTGFSSGEQSSIDLDPCSNWAYNSATMKAAKYYDKEKNGLLYPWYGRVYMNPPYSRGNLKVWTEYFLNQYEKGIMNSGICLVPNSTDADWFKPLWNYPICFTDHRIKFFDQFGHWLTNPEFGNAFVYAGKNVIDFQTEFSKHGTIEIKL